MSTLTPSAVAPSVPVAARRWGGFTATGALLRFALRRDRVRIPVWTVAVALMFPYAALAIETVYPTAADRQARALLLSTPAGVLMSGPGYGLDDYTLGALMANEMLLYGIVAVAVMSIQLVVRHTRTEEATGRAELVRASVVGRHAVLTSALLDVLVANAAVVVVTGAGMAAIGLAALDSFAMAIAMGLSGLVFGAVAAVTAQVTEYPRGATGAALGLLGVAFVLRGIGDVQQLHGSWVSWLSPIAWAQQTRAYVDLRWWPLALSVVAIVVGVAVAAALSVRRDVGAGLVPPRAGRADARPALAGPFALAWRQQRTSVLVWGAGLFLFAVAFGTLISSVEDMLAENPVMEELIGSGTDLQEGFAAVMLLFFALGVAAFGLAALLRMRTEEESGRAAPVLATRVTRSRWLAGGLIVAAVGTLALLALTALGTALGALAVGTDTSLVVAILLGALVYLPPLAVCLGLGLALYGWAPRFAGLAWVVVAWSFVVGMFGSMLGLSDAVRSLSPFEHVPLMPGGVVEAGPLLALTGVAAALVVAGFAGFRRRDVTG